MALTNPTHPPPPPGARVGVVHLVVGRGFLRADGPRPPVEQRFAGGPCRHRAAAPGRGPVTMEVAMER